MAEAVELGWVGKTRRAIGARLADLYDGVNVDAVETGLEGRDTITVKVRQGLTTPDGDCVCRAQFVIAPYIDICTDASRLTVAYDILDRLIGPCGEESVADRLGAIRGQRWHGVKLEWEGEPLGVVERVDPAVGYGLARFNEDGPATTVTAQIVVTVRTSCCGGG